MKLNGHIKGHPSIDIVEMDEGKKYALAGWNGEKYTEAYAVDEVGNAIDPKAPPIEITPIYAQRGEDDWEIVDYKII
jgi:hypothetical protein